MKHDSQNNGETIITTESGEKVIRKRKKRKHRKKMSLAAKIFATLGIIIAVAAVAAFAFFFHGAASVKGSMIDEDDPVPVQQAIEHNGKKYVFNENMVTILFIGHDDNAETTYGNASEADAIMAAAMDLETHEMTIIGIPRDTMCLVDQYANGEFSGTVTEQICLAYGYGATPEQASENVVKSARTVLCNVPIKYYYTLDEAAIAEANDAVGGVTLTPLQSIPKTDIVEGEETVLLGNNARRYVQYRDTSVLTSSKDRQDREIQYVKAFADQAFDVSSGIAKRITDLISIMSAYSTTNISASEMTYLTNEAATSIGNGIDFATLTGETTQNGRYAEVVLDKDELYEVVLDTYYKEVK